MTKQENKFDNIFTTKLKEIKSIEEIDYKDIKSRYPDYFSYASDYIKVFVINEDSTLIVYNEETSFGEIYNIEINYKNDTLVAEVDLESLDEVILFLEEYNIKIE